MPRSVDPDVPEVPDVPVDELSEEELLGDFSCVELESLVLLSLELLPGDVVSDDLLESAPEGA